MMRRLLIGAAIAAISIGAAAAADMPLKAAKFNPLMFPYNGSGFYFDVSTKAGVEQDSATGNFLGTSLATGTVNASGGSVGGSLGYIHGMQDKWVAVEASIYYSNVTGGGAAVSPSGNAVQASFASRWSADQVIKIGGWNPLAALGSLGFQFPALPTPPTIGGISVAANSHPYIMAGVEEWGISGQFFMANTGVDVGVAPLVGAGIMNQIVDSTGKLTGAVLDTGAQVVFADKGLSVNGLFGPGTPGVAQLSSGRKYEVFAKIGF